MCGFIRVDMVKSVLRRDVRMYATLLGLVGLVLGYETRCFSAGESARMFWCTRRMCIALQGTRHGGLPAGVGRESIDTRRCGRAGNARYTQGRISA